MYGGFKSLIPASILDRYEVHEWRNATAILHTVFPGEWAEVLDVLGSFKLSKSFIATGGGNKSNVSKTIDKAMYARGWVEKKFATAILLDEKRTDSPTHKIDCYKNSVGLEIEWNNKDPFFDRDLNNFRLLFELRALAVGIIVTRCDELQAIFDSLGRGPSYGESTTHMSKLLPKVEGGGAGGCPTLVFGIKPELYDPNS